MPNAAAGIQTYNYLIFIHIQYVPSGDTRIGKRNFGLNRYKNCVGAGADGLTDDRHKMIDINGGATRAHKSIFKITPRRVMAFLKSGRLDESSWCASSRAKPSSINN